MLFIIEREMAMVEREIILRVVQVLGITLALIACDKTAFSKGCNNTTQGPHNCKCPCVTSRMSKCYFPGREIEPLCVCQKGHEGVYCNRCQNGWYQNGNFSDPKAFCIPCNCSENLNFRKNNSCDPLTGKCLHCLPHTMGEQCELCAHGYHGDAVVAKNCTVLRGVGYAASKQGKHINKEMIIIATCSAIGAVCLAAIGYLLYHRYRPHGIKGRIPKFWTVELTNRNYSDLDFSLLDSVSDTPFVYRNDTNDFEEALIVDEGSKARLKIDMDASTFTENFDTSF